MSTARSARPFGPFDLRADPLALGASRPAGRRGRPGRAGRRRPSCRARAAARRPGPRRWRSSSSRARRPAARPTTRVSAGERLGLADQHLVAAGVGREAERLVAGRHRRTVELLLGRAGPLGGECGKLAVEVAELGRAATSVARRLDRHRGLRRSTRLALLAERLLEPPQRVAQLELAEHLAQARAVGRGCPRSSSRSISTGTSRDGGRELLRHARVLGVVRQVLLALRAGDLVDRRRARSRATPNCWSSSDAVLSPMPGTPGMLSEVSPFSP